MIVHDEVYMFESDGVEVGHDVLNNAVLGSVRFSIDENNRFDQVAYVKIEDSFKRNHVGAVLKMESDSEASMLVDLLSMSQVYLEEVINGETYVRTVSLDDIARSINKTVSNFVEANEEDDWIEEFECNECDEECDGSDTFYGSRHEEESSLERVLDDLVYEIETIHDEINEVEDSLSIIEERVEAIMDIVDDLRN